MKWTNKEKYLKYVTVLGSMLLVFPSGVVWYWGNMSVYSMSYFVVILNVPSGVNTPWILSTFLVCWTTGVTLSGSLAKRLDRRFVALIGMVVLDTGIFVSYYTNQISLAALTLTMGGMVGIGTGFVDSSGLQIVVDMADDDTGVLTAVVQSSMAFGGFVMNELITLYSNPQNLPPTFHFGNTKYFTEKQVLNRVPKTYLVLGLFAVISHILALILLTAKPNVESQRSNNHCQENNSMSYQTNVDDVRVNKEDKNVLKCSDFTPAEMLKTPSFYAIWFSFFAGEMSLTSLTNYYKSFGQEYIKDDHFLTTVGSSLILFGAVTSFFSGIAVDRLGLKNCFVFYSALVAILQIWYYLTPRGGKWLFGVVTTLAGCVNGVIFVSYLALIAILYGKTHFTTNFGILLTSQVLFNIMVVFLMGYILPLGWFVLFFITFAFSGVRMVLLIFALPASA